jgi:hypothetical protein
MDTVTILRRLWRFRLLVASAALFAIVVGCLVVYRYSAPLKLESRKYVVGVATARILVDTPASQVVDVAPKGSDQLGGRATLLANLMVDGEIKSAIAKKAGLAPNKLFSQSDAAPVDGAPAKPANPRGYALGTKVLTTNGGDALPIIEVDAQGPDAASAQRLANAAVAGLREYLDSKAAVEQVPDAQRLRISGLSQAEGHLAVRGPRLLIGVVVAIFLFGFSCIAILLIAGLISALRGTPQTARPPEDLFAETAPADDEWSTLEADWEPLGEAALVPAEAVESNGNGNGSAPAAAGDQPEAAEAPVAGSAKRSASWWGGRPG